MVYRMAAKESAEARIAMLNAGYVKDALKDNSGSVWTF